MITTVENMNEPEQKAIVCLCILAAFADGAQADAERAQIERIVHGFANGDLDAPAAYQDVLGGRVTLNELAGRLQTPAARALAYEMAVCVCHADGAINDTEQRFLNDLRQALQLDAATADPVQQSAGALAVAPLAVPPRVSDVENLDRMILNYAILNGALEIMPHSLATLAIIPLQMRMVYRIGKSYGFELGRGHIKDFFGTVGVGLTSQVFEGVASRLLGRLTRGLAGGLVGALAGQATASAVGFASTYALGQVARQYYAGGRTLTGAQLRETFAAMLDEARGLQPRYRQDIVQRSREVNVTELLPLVRQN
jgi:uncharacterized protein (DUF697 family)/tellurite resistance protein